MNQEPSTASADAARRDQGKVVVKCPGCQTALAVRTAREPQVVKCPRCGKHLRVGPGRAKAAAAAPAAASGRSSAAGDPAATPAPATPAARPAAAARASGAVRAPAAKRAAGAAGRPAAAAAAPRRDADAGLGLDFSWESLPAQTATPSFPPHAPLHSAARQGGGANAFLHWMNGHRWITLIVALNVVCTVLALTLGLAVGIVGVVNGVLGAVVIGLLQLPRLHLVARFIEVFGQAAANLSAGALILVLLGAGFKLLRGAGRVGLDASQLPIVLGMLALQLGVLVLFVFLWHRVGLARLLGAVYVGQLSLVTIPLLALSIPVVYGDEEAQIARLTGSARHEEAEAFAEPFAPATGQARPPRPARRFSGADAARGAAPLRELRVEIEFDPEDREFNPHREAEALMRRAGDPPWRLSRGSGRVVLFVRYAGSTEDFARLIDFGTVTRSDARARAIEVLVRGASAAGR